MKLKDLEASRRAWFVNFPREPQESLASLANLVAQLPRALPTERQRGFGQALLLLLEATERSGLNYEELQSYRFKTEPGWRNCLITLQELQAEPADFESFSAAYCCLWHSASSLKVWRQDVIRGAAAVLRNLQLELLK